MRDDDRSDLAALPPQDPRGKRLRRWIPGVVILGGLVVLGLLIRFVWEESPVLEPKKPTPRATTGQETNHVPSALNDLREAAQRREVSTTPEPSAKEQAQARQLADALARIDALERQRDQEASQAKTVTVEEKAKPAPKPDAEAKRRAEQDAKAAKDAARKKREEDAAAKKARLIWERKSDKADAVGSVTTVKSLYALMPGWHIPCAMQHAISSQAAGVVLAFVRQNVYDSATGEHLLIPQGAKLIGTSSGGQAFGDEIQRATFSKMVVDKRIYGLGNAMAEDVTGSAGLSDQIDRHWGRAALSVLLTPALNVLRMGGSAGRGAIDQNVGEALIGEAAQQTATVGAQKMQPLLNISPTLTLRQGFLCEMTVVDPIIFNAPYTVASVQLPRSW